MLVSRFLAVSAAFCIYAKLSYLPLASIFMFTIKTWVVWSSRLRHVRQKTCITTVKGCAGPAVGDGHFGPSGFRNIISLMWCLRRVLTSWSAERLHFSLPAVQLGSFPLQLLLSPQQLSCCSRLVLHKHTFIHIKRMSIIDKKCT